ncbi:MAG: glycine C-acetyltransferase [Bacteroidetes bacterium]|nr:glycine C-acetyltransferase [Bacteroidota bacterium]
MFGDMKKDITQTLEKLRREGLYKQERILTSPQGSRISVHTETYSGTVLNFCSNNYLGLASHPDVVKAAQEAMDTWGFGLSSVRFICGTQQLHKDLEKQVSAFLGTEDTLLYAACFDANGGVFEPLLGSEDAIISDSLNHASIIDGVRLCKALRYRYSHSSMQDLERCLKESVNARYRLICTDGVFSMDGDTAKLAEICNLADRYDALVMVDDSHATGYIGKTGRGTPELTGTIGRVDIITTTFGKALGGASGGCTSGRKEIINLLRQRSRPYLFSNTLAPAVAGGTQKVLEILSESTELRDRLVISADYFRKRMKDAGFDIVDGDTAIVPVMLYDEKTAAAMADALLLEGIYAISFSYPVVPKGKARIRLQISAAHTKEDLDFAVDAFVKVGKSMGLAVS